MSVLSVVLPHYTRVHESATGKPYLRFEVSTAIKKAGFVPSCVSLGSDIAKAIAKVENDLLPRLRAFQAGASAIAVQMGPVPGTVDELVHTYKTDETSVYHNCSDETKVENSDLLDKACNHVLQGGSFKGMRMGSVSVTMLQTTDARRLMIEYEKVETAEVDSQTGETVVTVTKRSRTAEKVFGALRAAFNGARGIYSLAPQHNPFEKQRFATRMHEVKHATTFEDLIETLIGADQIGLSNMATMAFVAYDLEMRVLSIPSKLRVEHYKPADRPHQMLIKHWKTKRQTWIDLHDEDGAPLYPALEQRLDACKGTRTTGILIPMDGTEDKPWSTCDRKLPSAFYRTFRKLMRLVGLPEECEFTSFRHGGITGTAEAGCSENEMMILSGHASAATVQLYVKRSRRARIKARKKVLAHQAEMLTRMAKAKAEVPAALQPPAPAIDKI
jgi:integrase